MLSWGNYQPHRHAKTDHAILSSVVMHIYVCLWLVGSDWNVPEPLTLLVHTRLLVII